VNIKEASGTLFFLICKLWKNWSYRETWGSHSIVAEDSDLLMYYDVLLGK